MTMTEYITFGGTIITLIILLYNQNKNGNKEISERVERDTKISTKLDMLITNTNELKHDISRTNDKIEEISQRLTVVEQSTKQAHKRIDDFHTKK